LEFNYFDKVFSSNKKKNHASSSFSSSSSSMASVTSVCAGLDKQLKSLAGNISLRMSPHTSEKAPIARQIPF
jgi:hypothetical protein